MTRFRFSAITATALAIFAALSVGCSGTKPATTAPPANRSAASGIPSTRTVSTSSHPNSVPSIAQREVIRRREMVRQMDEAAIKASQRMAEDDLEGAVEGYRRAIGQ